MRQGKPHLRANRSVAERQRFHQGENRLGHTRLHHGDLPCWDQRLQQDPGNRGQTARLIVRSWSAGTHVQIEVPVFEKAPNLSIIGAVKHCEAERLPRIVLNRFHVPIRAVCQPCPATAVHRGTFAKTVLHRSPDDPPHAAPCQANARAYLVGWIATCMERSTVSLIRVVITRASSSSTASST